MAIVPLKDATLLLGGVDLGPYSNQFMLDIDREALDKTNFASDGWKEFTGGLNGATWNYQGFLDPTVVEPRLLLINPTSADPGIALGGASEPVVSMVTITRPPAEEDIAFMMRCIRTKVNPGSAKVGQLAEYNVTLLADSPMLRGQVLGIGSAVTASGESDGFEISAVGATQRLYASLHVAATAADTLDVEIESDVDGDFNSPTTRATFAQVDGTTAHAYEYVTAAGPITDTFWRVKWTLGDAGPFSFTVFMAIAS